MAANAFPAIVSAKCFCCFNTIKDDCLFVYFLYSPLGDSGIRNPFWNSCLEPAAVQFTSGTCFKALSDVSRCEREQPCPYGWVQAFEEE